MAKPDRNKINCMLYALLILVICHEFNGVEAKRIYSSNSGRRTSPSSSTTSVRRTNTHSSGSYSPGSLSYPNYSQVPKKTTTITHSAPPKPAQTHYTPPKPAQNYHPPTVKPIGWDVPKPQGPPPPYSATNPIGGAHTNPNLKPPPYNPGYVNSPSAPAANKNFNNNNNNINNNNNRPITPTQLNNQQSFNNRNRMNSTGGIHTPITATHNNNVQSSYPKQQGVNYYPSGSNLPPGASFHPNGQIPAGATFHPNGQIPAGATYHPNGQIPHGTPYHPPAGTAYYPPGAALPPGASYHQGPPPPVYHAPPPVYYPQTIPAGATILPAGSVIPVGATIVQQPPKSSGLGFGSGFATGAITGGIVGHLLTPTHTRTVERVPEYGGGGGRAPPQNEDKIIIINNGPPGSVTTTDVGGGTTVINTNQGQPQAPAAAPLAPMAPMAPAQAPVGPGVPAPAPYNPQPNNYQPTNYQPNYQAPIDPNQPPAMGGVAPVAPGVAGAAVPVVPGQEGAPVVPAVTEAPPIAPGSIICYPGKISQPDPNDSNKTIEVDHQYCYSVPAEPQTPPPPTEIANLNATAAGGNFSTIVPTQATNNMAQPPNGLETKASQAPYQSAPVTPITVPHGSVALTPFNPSSAPDIIKIPGEYNKNQRSQSYRASGVRSNSGSAHNYGSMGLVTLVILLVTSNWQ